MLADKFNKKPLKPFNLNGLKAKKGNGCTKGVRNLLCDWLYHDGLVISYAPSNEFASHSVFKLYLGGWVVEFVPEIQKFCQVKPLYKINFRIINQLYEAGILEVRTDLKRPHQRFIMFSWSKEAIENRRDIMRNYILNDEMQVTTPRLGLVANLYGLSVQFVSSRRAFEITRANGEAIPKGKTSRTWIFSNNAGDPVSKLNDMSILEWEDVCYHVAKRIGTATKFGAPPSGSSGFFSLIKTR